MPATSPYSEPDRAISYRTSYFVKIHLNIIPHFRLRLPSVLFPSGFPTTILYTPLLSPIPLHAQHISFSSIWSPQNILGEEYRSIVIITLVLAYYLQISYSIITHPVEMQRNLKVSLKVFQYSYCVKQRLLEWWPSFCLQVCHRQLQHTATAVLQGTDTLWV